MSRVSNMKPDGYASPGSPPRVFISAAEPSADRHAAPLIDAVRTGWPGVRFLGVAGPRMQAAGCEVIEDFTDRSRMLVGAVGLAGHAFRLLRRVRRLLAEQPVDLAILVDSPALHLPMAKKVRSAGSPVFYYIAPQLWAWAPWRIRRVRRRVDRMGVILPFEEEYFRSRGVDARFVGHPLVEQLRSSLPSPGAVDGLKGLGRPVVACLPGSRRHVIEEVLPGQIAVARCISARHAKAVFLFAAAHETAASMISDAVASAGLNHRIEVDANAAVLGAADLALCASGTATLEVAFHRVPMVVMYNGSKWGYKMVGRWLISTPHLSLVNILAGRRVVPEFMPYYDSIDPIAAEALDLLANTARRTAMQAELGMVIDSLGTTSAAWTAAKMVIDMIREKRSGLASRPGN